MTILRNEPNLHAALVAMSNEHVFLSGPNIDGRPTRWMPCSCCDNVVAVGPVVVDGRVHTVVATICEDCEAPCPNADCGLLVHEHRGGCEPWEGCTCGEAYGKRHTGAKCGYCRYGAEARS